METKLSDFMGGVDEPVPVEVSRIALTQFSGVRRPGHLLGVALWRAKKEGYDVSEQVKICDSRGRAVGIRLSGGVVVARSYVWQGKIVSVHDLVLDVALRWGVPILMYVLELRRLFVLDAGKVLGCRVGDNLRGGEVMVNFVLERALA